MKDLFDIFPEPGERQTDIELIIEEKKEMAKIPSETMNKIIAQKLTAAVKQLEAAHHRIAKYDAGNAQNIEAAAWLAQMAAEMAEEYKGA